MERQYDKLIRDNIPDMIKKQGNIPVTRKLSDTEYQKYLDKKLKEEVDEYLNGNHAEELCDILEVVKAIYSAMNITEDEIEAMREEKKNGAFKNKILLEKIIYK